MSQENKALARRSWEAVDNPDLIDEVYAPNLVWHEPDQEVQGSEQAKQVISMYKSAFPDFFYRVEDQIAEGDKMTTRYTMGGTHQGEFFGVPGSRKRIEISGINVDRFDESGKRDDAACSCLAVVTP